MLALWLACAWIGDEEHCLRLAACPSEVDAAAHDTARDDDTAPDTAADTDTGADTGVDADTATDTGPPPGDRRLLGEITSFDIEIGGTYDSYDGVLAVVDATHREAVNTRGLVVSSPGYAGVGWAFVYAGPLDAFDSFAAPTASWPGYNGTEPRFGESMARAGDIDGDGFDDLVIGQEEREYGAGPWVVFEPGADMATIDSFAYDVASCCYLSVATPGGDLDGDGYDELILGHTNGVTAMLGHATAATDGPTWLLGYNGAESTDAAGTSVAVADLEGDGAPELLVGAPGRANGVGQEGAVYVFAPEPGYGTVGIEVQERARIDGDAANVRLGEWLSAGDVDGDGTDDLAIGGANSAWLATNVPMGAPLSVATLSNRRDGGTLRIGGDADLDGLADVAAAVPCAADGGATCAGIYYGPADNIAADPDAVAYANGGHAGLLLRSSVVLDDVSGDGAADLVVAIDNTAGDDRLGAAFGVGIALGGRVE